MSDETTPATRSAPTGILRLLGLTVAGVLAVGVAACGSDDVAESLAERLAGDGTEVDIDSESGSMDITTDDGNMSMGSGELPADWPAEIPLPDDFSVEMGFQASNEDGQTFTVMGTTSDDPQTVFEQVSEEFTSSGWDEQHSGTTNFDGNTASNAMFDNGTWTVAFGTNSSDDEVTVSYTVVPSG